MRPPEPQACLTLIPFDKREGLSLGQAAELAGNYFDSWKPAKSSGDADLDMLLGELYADNAVRHARDPAFVWLVMAAIYFKTTRGHIVMGATEQGFLTQLLASLMSGR